MRNAVLVVLGLVVLWALVGGRVDVRSPTPSNQIPTFRQSLADREEIEMAYNAGRLVEDPDRREIRQAVLDTWDMVEYSPCDEDLKRAYRTAAKRFVQTTMEARPSPSETIEVDGRLIDGSRFFNVAASERIRDGFLTGRLRPEDLSLRTALIKKLATNFMGQSGNVGNFGQDGNCE